MSLTYSNILDKIDDNCGTNSTSYTTAKKTVDVNLAIDNLMLMLFGEGAGGSWQLDDSNHTKYPIIMTDIVSGQRDYFFVTDEQGNIILDVYKVMVKKSSTGPYEEITPVDQQGDDAATTMNDGQDTTGIPTQYDKTGNGIFLDLIPNYNATRGIKVWINREASYFTASDTTKKWGFTGLYHEYLVLSPSYQYARAKRLDNRNDLKRDLIEMEEKIKKHIGQRQRDVKKKVIPMRQDNR